MLGFVSVYLAIQLLVPLRYYLAAAETDERFSWRMFSAVAVRQCEPFVFESAGGGPRSAHRPLPLRGTVQGTWVRLLQRGQLPVVREFLRWRCRESKARRVRFELHCTAADGSTIEPLGLSLDCVSGQEP